MINQFKFFQGEATKERIIADYMVADIPVEISNSIDSTILDSNWYQNYTRYVPNEQQRHGFCAGVHRTQLLLHYEGDIDIESVRAMLHDLTYRYRTCVSFSDFTLNNMEDYLNEHLSGTSTIRLA